MERVAKGGVRVVRLGHPARLLPGIQKHSLDAILSNSEATQLVRDVRKDIDKSLVSLNNVPNCNHLRIFTNKSLMCFCCI